MSKVTPEGVRRWAQRLRETSGWKAHLNAIFDNLSFTESYIQRIAPPGLGDGKSVKDKVWGMIELSPAAVAIVDCPLFQRLRSVRQVGFTYLTYPTAKHTRFEHCLGVYHVVQLLLDQFDRTAASHRGQQDLPKPVGVDRDQAEIVKIAAMLHDIGHGPFSHVSESVFSRRKDKRHFGPLTVERFISLFQEHCPGVVTEQKVRVPLSEIMSAVVVTSDRFQRFLEKIFPDTNGDDVHVAHKIATLIMGGRLDVNDLSVPSMLSGASDADKIDYMRRDSIECGVPLGIDVSRVFMRAGIYECDYSQVVSLSPNAGLENRPVRLFLIDRSGQDTIQEFGAARLSLYSRVYHHPLTRNAERQFQELMRLALEHGPEDELGAHNDFVSHWAAPEDVLLHRFLEHGYEDVRKSAANLTYRRLPSRAASYSDRHFRDLAPTWIKDRIDRSPIEKNKQEVVEWLDAVSISEADHEELSRSIINEAKRIRDIVASSGDGGGLPTGSTPDQFYIVGRPDSDEVILQEAFILNADRTLSKPESIHPPYYEAGALARSVGFIFADKSWRELVALSFQVILAKKASIHNIDFNWMAAEPLVSMAGDLEDKTKDKDRIKAIFRPVLNLAEVAHRCKLRTKYMDNFQRILSAQKYYDNMPYLVPTTIPDQDAEELALKFRTYQGDANWIVDIKSVRGFIGQFPVDLRLLAIDMLKEIKTLDRPTVTRNLIEQICALEDFGSRKLRLAPLTLSSGSRARSFLRSFVDETQQLECHINLREALSVASDEDRIVLIDDNISSGSQSSLQMRAWFDALGESESDDNIDHIPLDPASQAKLRDLRTSFVFCVGHNDGFKKLLSTVKDLSLQIEEGDIKFKENIENLSGKAKVSEKLREFLAKVGYSLLYRRRRLRHPDEGPEAWQSYAERNQLGFGGYEALISTALNVPSSTYPALWCPGVYWPDGNVQDEEDTKAVAWLPLLIRDDSARLLVLP